MYIGVKQTGRHRHNAGANLGKSSVL